MKAITFLGGFMPTVILVVVAVLSPFLISLTYSLYIVPTHFSLSVFQPFWAQNTARDTWTLWGNGIRASIVRIPTRVTTSSVAEQKYTSIAAPKKTKSFSQKYKSKYPNPLHLIPVAVIAAVF